MQKVVVGFLLILLSGCLIEEKHYHGCDGKTEIKEPDTVEEKDSKEFFDLFEEVTATSDK